MKIRVYIATTEGPVEILKLTEEDPQVKSVVCLNGKAMPLPITRGYHSFVQDPTGVIQRTFGHSAYRLDVSAPVDDGYSWQLPVFAAHALFADDVLAKGGEKPDRAVWLTGEVDRELKVHGIDRLGEKCERSRKLFDDLAQNDIPLSIILSKDNEPDIPEWVKTRAAKAQRLRLETVESAFQLAPLFDLQSLAATEKKRRTSQTSKKKPVKRKGRKAPPAWAAWSAAAVVLFAVLGLSVVQAGVLEWTRMHNAGEEERLQSSLQRAVSGGCATCRIYARAFMTVTGIELPAPPEQTVPPRTVAGTTPEPEEKAATVKPRSNAKTGPDPDPPARQPAAKNSGEAPAPQVAAVPKAEIPKAAPPIPKRPKRPSTPVLKVQIHEMRAPEPLRCADVHDGQVKAVERKVLRISDRRFAASPMLDLCRVKLEVQNNGAPAYMWAFAIAVPERRLLVGDRSALYGGDKHPSGQAVWDIRVPPRAERALNYHFVALASDEPMGDTVAPLIRSLMRRGRADYVDDWNRVRRTLRREGIVVSEAWHELRPGLAGLPEDSPVFNN